VAASLFHQQAKEKHTLLQAMFVIMLMDLDFVTLVQAHQLVADVHNAKS
jgi:hypothetical protein